MIAEFSVFMVFLAVLVTPQCGCAALSWVSPGQSLEDAIALLAPGDTLNVHGGVYRVPTVRITAQGRADQWIVVRAAPGEFPVVRGTSTTSNLFAIRGAAYMALDGIEIDSVPPDVMPIRFEKTYGVSHDMLFVNFHIHDVPSVAVDAKGDHYNITFRRCHIHHTSDGTAEGFYIGDHTGIDHPHHWIIENCWIHHTGYLNSSQGDGIEIKYGCWAMTVRNNVIHNTAYPAILYYGYNGAASDTVRTCLIEGNVVWNADEAIGAYADAIVRNNIVFSSYWPVASMQYSGHKAPENVEIYNNTFYDYNAVYLRAWDSTRHCVFANNAEYPTPGTAADDLSDPAAMNAYPKAGSSLINAATGPYVAQYDFNNTLRDASPDIGAYEFTTTSNPGWAVADTFKPGGPADPSGIVVSGLLNAPQINLLDCYPNPAGPSTAFFLKVRPELREPFVLSLYDVLGRKMGLKLFPGRNNGLQNLNPGRYLIRLEGKRISCARGLIVE